VICKWNGSICSYECKVFSVPALVLAVVVVVVVVIVIVIVIIDGGVCSLVSVGR